MVNATITARTVSIAKEYSCEIRNGRNGQFQAKSIMFIVACDRNNRTTSVVNGQQVQETHTDFFLVKFVNGAADTMQKYATSKKPDGKLVSRHISGRATIESYKSTKPIKATMKNMNFNGQTMDISGFATPDGEGITQLMFVVDQFEFLDANPNNNSNNAQNTPATFTQTMQNQNFTMPTQQMLQPTQMMQGQPTPVASAMPTQQAMPVAPVQNAIPVPQAQKTTAPINAIPTPIPSGVVPTAPVAPVQQANPSANQQSNFAGIMANVAQQMAAQQAQNAVPTAPTIPANFQPTDASAPF